jgi:hypothetical protein
MNKTPSEWADYYQRGNSTDPLAVIINAAMAQAVEEFKGMAVALFEDEVDFGSDGAEYSLNLDKRIRALPNPYQSKGE